MATAAVPANIAAALRYGPQTQSSLRRSQYLTTALQQMQADGGKNIQSPLELGAKLLATAILKRQSDKADASAVTALKADQDNETTSLVSALRGTKPPAPAMPITPQVQPQAQPQAQAPQIPQQQPVSLPSAQTPPPVSQLALNPEVDKLVRTVWGEARGEDPLGQQGVANVVINRAKKGGKSINDVVLERNQFEPWSNPQTRAQLEALTPDSADYQKILANIAPALQGQDVTGGADHFYSPTAQQGAGRAPPTWDNGSGVDHGRHRFFNLGYGGQGAHQRQNPSEMFQPPQPQQPPVNVASNGQIDASMLPASAPVGPSGGGAAPVAPNAPQAAATGANQWPTYQPTESEIGYVQELLNDPQRHDLGVSEYQKLRQKMTQPAEAQVVQMNGVSYYVSKTPGQGGQPVMIPVPQEARTQTVTAQQAGLPFAPQGAYVQQDPYGNLKEAPFAPAQGYNAGPNGYSPIRGGPADPARPQAPQQSYQYSNGGMGRQEAIPGGPADLKSPSNVMEGANRYGGMVKTIVDSAMKVKQNFGAVKAGFAQRNGTGDIAMTNGLQKLIDDGVVKGEDVTMQMKSNGLDGSVGGYKQYLNSGGLFTDDVRNKLYKTADALYRNLDQTYKVRVQSLSPGFDEVYGAGAFGKYVFPEAFSHELGWAGTPQGGQQPPSPNPSVVAPKAGTREGAIAYAKKHGLLP